MKIEFQNGSVIEFDENHSGEAVRGMNSKSYFRNEEESEKKQETMKFTDKHGHAEAEVPADREILELIVGYPHDPETHNYNRAERRRIINFAKKLEKLDRKNK